MARESEKLAFCDSSPSFFSGQAQPLEVQTDSTHISKVGQQVEGEEGLHVRGGLGPARRRASQLWQNAVTCIT